ncbi:cytochrome P450 [Artomyces pyxidatus]|uniref:Cytochrome P450 n=1 Tax=Artomyces pyxidatus TaxID=48021 RepID=A0ACB8T6E8_9AGAM|nr:cytochrome P450 [Artomyces pyxidatus]
MTFYDNIVVAPWLYLAVALGLVFIVSRVLKLVNGLKAVSWLPGFRLPLDQLGPPGALIPYCWWNRGMYLTWNERFTFYQGWNSETVSSVPFLIGPPAIYTSSVEVARQIVGGGPKSAWIKTLGTTRVTSVWGDNVLSTNNPEWRKHRRILGPAFTQTSTYVRLWSNAQRIYHEMTAFEGWDTQDEIEIPVMQKLTFRFALNVILSLGFGVDLPWDSPPGQGDEVTLQEALRLYSDNVMFFVLVPKWIQRLPFPWFKKMAVSHRVISDYMHGQVTERRAEINGGAESKSDVFSMLIQASEEDGKLSLTDSEVIGNVFSLLFAGHETTAQTFTIAIGYLGIYPDVQQEMYDEILQVVGKDRDPVYEDFGSLQKILALFYECVRLYPSGYIMLREATEDTVLTIPNDGWAPGTRTIAIEKGTHGIVDVIGMQLNPRYFDNPSKFDPSRWYGVSSDSETISAWSIGPRTCIGRKFAFVEAVCFLTLFIRDWHVEPILRKGESTEEWRERVMVPKLMLSLGVQDVPVKLTRRTYRKP